MEQAKPLCSKPSLASSVSSVHSETFGGQTSILQRRPSTLETAIRLHCGSKRSLNFPSLKSPTASMRRSPVISPTCNSQPQMAFLEYAFDYGRSWMTTVTSKKRSLTWWRLMVANISASTIVSGQLARSPGQAHRIHIRELGGVVLRERTAPAPPIPKQTPEARATALRPDLCSLAAEGSREACIPGHR